MILHQSIDELIKYLDEEILREKNGSSGDAEDAEDAIAKNHPTEQGRTNNIIYDEER